MRVVVRVHPGGGRSFVGGRYGTSEPATLVVRVSARAVDGEANEAVLTEVARAFGIPRRQVRLVSGVTSRTKVLELTGADAAALARLLAVDSRPKRGQT